VRVRCYQVLATGGLVCNEDFAEGVCLIGGLRANRPTTEIHDGGNSFQRSHYCRIHGVSLLVTLSHLFPYLCALNS